MSEGVRGVVREGGGGGGVSEGGMEGRRGRVRGRE